MSADVIAFMLIALRAPITVPCSPSRDGVVNLLGGLIPDSTIPLPSQSAFSCGVILRAAIVVILSLVLLAGCHGAQSEDQIPSIRMVDQSVI
jgi:hypothetical protein